MVAFQNRALERLRALPGVESAALADEVPFGGNDDCRGFHAQGRMKPNTVDDPCIERYGVTPDYARLMGIPLRRGRGSFRPRTRPPRSRCSSFPSRPRSSYGAATTRSDRRCASASRRTLRGTRWSAWSATCTTRTSRQPVTAAMYTAETQFTDSYLVAMVKVLPAIPRR